MEDFYEPQSWKVGTGNGKPPQPPPRYGHHKGHKSPGMPHSQSEGNINYLSRGIQDHNFRVGKTLESFASDYKTRSSQDTDASSSISRGRTITRTPSPVKALEDIKEDQTSDSTPSPTKRSRSPCKQMFGENGWLGRSTSMHELPNERYRKNGIKHWGGKIKQRVENLVSLRVIFVKSFCLQDRPRMSRRCQSSYRQPSTSANRPPSLLRRPNFMSPLVLPCRQSSTRKWSL